MYPAAGVVILYRGGNWLLKKLNVFCNIRTVPREGVYSSLAYTERKGLV